ncbi:MAG: type II toxin-antitoxin system VapC family toxin [Terracidiphilus sp.]
MILLDTHVVIWSVLTPERISRPAAKAILQDESGGKVPGISVITMYEVANAIRRGRLQLTVPYRVFRERIQNRFRLFPVTGVIAALAAEMAEHFPSDPMDRLIAATAAAENGTLITADRRILTAGVCKTLW